MGFKIGLCGALNEMSIIFCIILLPPSCWVWFLPEHSVYERNVSSFISYNVFSCLLTSAAMFANELLRQEQAKLNEARKISVVNVNPTNIRPHSDTPEIRKYKKRFNSEILCAALWGTSCSLWYLSFFFFCFNCLSVPLLKKFKFTQGLCFMFVDAQVWTSWWALRTV